MMKKKTVKKTIDNKSESNTSIYRKLVKIVQKHKSWIPVILIVVVLTISFIFGWYIDKSKPIGGIGWSDQTLYTKVTQQLTSAQLPSRGQMVYSIGYSLLGLPGAFILYNNPFVFISYSLLIASALFCYFGAINIIGPRWSLLFCASLFYWDRVGNTFNFAFELFVVPWNNQVLFFAFAYFFWLFTLKLQKPFSNKLLVVTSTVAGVVLLTREESLIFVIPLTIIIYIIHKVDIRRILISLMIIISFVIPQLILKQIVLGSVSESGRGNSYKDVSSEYLNPSLFVRNIREVVINSSTYKGEPLHPEISKQCKTQGACASNGGRKALLQAAPWLWLAPIGLLYIFASRSFSLGLKIYLLASVGLIIFYLSGANMAAVKLIFFCLRYISPGFISLNFVVIVLMKTLYDKFNSQLSDKQEKING